MKGGGPILIVAPSWIGDTIMMQPLLSRLRAQRPDSKIHVLAPAWCTPLLARMPEVAAIIENPFAHGEFNWEGRRALGRRLASTGFFSEAYVLPNSWKSALVPFFAGIPLRIGYHGEARYLLLNRRQRLDAAALPRLVDRYAALAGPADGPTPQPHLSSTSEQQRDARRALGLDETVAPVVFCPGAEYGPAKRWPAGHFAALAGKLGASGTPVWIVGGAKDRETGDEIAALSQGAASNLCGRTDLEQAIDLIAGARLVVSNDSGLMHVAAALDRPLLALYGSSSPDYTPPLSPRAKILSLNLDCSPCFKRECPLGHLHCLEELTPAQVLKAVPEGILASDA
ncbi:MAG: lipopolysaccharide heptosyltransferase II [Gammaproteobacteria bacterium]|nr:lipopolysaccharide heptosyltransferase II [Gammaproteobacteria bacterium]MBU1646082.1 lipopolysaccharide heptosyltransferase II [Gammaproteobacteria bacterium]MBU1972144.1 lipopolysaccharide heptosyltransferase II [Gammaproteobacteria bacterium]